MRYVDPEKELETKKGWLSKLTFWKGEERTPDQSEYLISLVGSGASTQVVVLDREGNREQSNTADRILALLHQQLK